MNVESVLNDGHVCSVGVVIHRSRRQVIAQDLTTVDEDDGPVVPDQTQHERLQLARVIDLEPQPKVIGRVVLPSIVQMCLFVAIPVAELGGTLTPRVVLEVELGPVGAREGAGVQELPP